MLINEVKSAQFHLTVHHMRSYLFTEAV